MDKQIIALNQITDDEMKRVSFEKSDISDNVKTAVSAMAECVMTKFNEKTEMTAVRDRYFSQYITKETDGCIS